MSNPNDQIRAAAENPKTPVGNEAIEIHPGSDVKNYRGNHRYISKYRRKSFPFHISSYIMFKHLNDDEKQLDLSFFHSGTAPTQKSVSQKIVSSQQPRPSLALIK